MAALAAGGLNAAGRADRAEQVAPGIALVARRCTARLHLIAAGPMAVSLHVRVDGGAARTLEVEWPMLYILSGGEACGEHLLEFAAEAPGPALFSATFG